jgi:RIO kinase 1
MRRPVTAFVHSTYRDAHHGPQPLPRWVITEDAAEHVERGILKTGKEADVHGTAGSF